MAGADFSGLQNVWQDPWFQAGIGMLGSNVGGSGDAAFRNALQGGMGGLLRGQTMTADIARQQAQTQALQQQQEARARQMEQQRRLAAAAPQLATGLLSQDPDMQRQAMTGILSMAPEMLPQMIGGKMLQGMMAPQGQQAPGYMSREEILKEYNAADYTPESWQSALSLGNPGVLQPKPVQYGFGEESSLRKEAAQRIEPIRTAVSQADQLDRLLDRKGPFSDVASVYSLIRFLDPGSVVREGEIGIVSAAQGLWNQIQGMLQQAQGQGFLTDAMREDMRGMLNELTTLYEQQYKNFRGYYETTAGQYKGIDPRRVVGAPVQFPDMSPNRPTAKAAAGPIASTPALDAALQRNR